MKQTAIVVAPGRGTYNREELGYLSRHHADKSDLIATYDAYRASHDQPTISALDGAERFSGATHIRGDNASALIHACACADFLSIDRDRFDILGVTGNSMGWYIALTCAGALEPLDGLHVVNTMGTLMHNHAPGGQTIYPYVDDTWRAIPGRREEILTKAAEINAGNATLALSIDLGGMLVLAGDEAGLVAFEAAMPRVQDRFPLRLPGHAAFHTALMADISTMGQSHLGFDLFQQPTLPLIDGRGGMWFPKATNLPALRGYTLGHQVTEPYDFANAIHMAARDFMPDVFIILGPGTTLGGSVAQSLIAANWRGLDSKAIFQTTQKDTPRLLSMGMEDQRSIVTGS